MNQYSWWQYLLIGLVVLIGVIYAAPNLFAPAPAVQISPARTSIAIDQTLSSKVQSKLDLEKLGYTKIELASDRLLVRFADAEVQLKAQDILRDYLGRDYVVALNLAPSTPGFMQALGLNPMYLGLDLRGGVHFLMEVDMQAALRQVEESYMESLRTLLRDKNIRNTGLARDGSGIKANFANTDDRAKALTAIRDEFRNLQVRESEQGADLTLTMSPQEIKEKRDFALKQNITILRNRINELGVAEPIIQQQGDSRIVVELPGVQDTARAKEILGATATLEFRLVDWENNMNAEALEKSGKIPLNSRLYKTREGRPVLLQRSVIITGDRINDAASGIDQQTAQPAVFINLDGQGARRMENATKDNIGKPMAVVFIENKTETTRVNGEVQRKSYKTEEVINVATIRDRLSHRFQITGLDSPQEARNLALLLRAGALAAPLSIIEERTVGPSAGKDNIDQGFRAAWIALVIIVGFMCYYYRAFGVVASITLIANVILLVAILSMLQATLTLPGIAGIILTMGMAVDANVLIYERIREELKLGSTPQAAIHAGFNRAFATILDSNLTTLIAGVVCLGIGSGPIKGFGVTLSIGILTTLFTAVLCTRALVNYWYGGRKVQALAI